MKFGIIPTEGGALFQEALAEVVLAEELGFDSVWMEEHHSIPGHYWPSPLVVLTAFGARTSASCWAPTSSSRPSTTRYDWPRMSRSSRR